MSPKKSSHRQKHIPQRTCIACRQIASKRDLIRIVRTENGVEIDPSGKMAGRGAYLHAYLQCWQKAIDSKRLEQALRIQLSSVDHQKLLAFMSELAETEMAIIGQ